MILYPVTIAFFGYTMICNTYVFFGYTMICNTYVYVMLVLEQEIVTLLGATDT